MDDHWSSIIDARLTSMDDAIDTLNKTLTNRLLGIELLFEGLIRTLYDLGDLYTLLSPNIPLGGSYLGMYHTLRKYPPGEDKIRGDDAFKGLQTYIKCFKCGEFIERYEFVDHGQDCNGTVVAEGEGDAEKT